MEIEITYIILHAVPIFFWARGIIRNNRNDMIAGVILLYIVSLVIFAMMRHIPALASPFICFGAVTYIAGAFAKNNSELKSKNRNAIGIFFIALGLCASIIM